MHFSVFNSSLVLVVILIEISNCIIMELCHFKQIIATTLLVTPDAVLLIWTTCLLSQCYITFRVKGVGSGMIQIQI